MHENDLRYLRFLKRFRGMSLPVDSMIGLAKLADSGSLLDRAIAQYLLENVDDGGPGSGNFGHKGRPGLVGGSGKGGGAQYRGGRSDIKYHSSKHDWLNGLQGEEQHEAASWLKGKQSDYPIDPDNKKPIEQRIMESGSDEDKDKLLGMMSKSRSWDEYSDRLKENLDDNEKKLAETLGNKYGLDPKTGMPDDSDMSLWTKEDRDYWRDLKSKAMGGPTSGNEPPDELMYEAGLKERPKPKSDTTWYRNASPELKRVALYELQKASGMSLDDAAMTTGTGIEEAEKEAFRRIDNFRAQRNLGNYLSNKWIASGGDLSDPKIQERLTPEEYGKLRNIVLRSNMQHDQTPIDTLDYMNMEERIKGYALINKALGGADASEIVEQKIKEKREREEEEKRRDEERRKQEEERQRRQEEERERVQRERERVRQEELKNGISFITRGAEANGVERREVTKLSSELTHDEIVARVAGGDRTGGSCVSLSLAYAANRFGLDVLDFRGGKSTNLLAKVVGVKDIAESPGVKSSIVTSHNDLSAAKSLLKTMEPGKEYILCTGSHMSVVRVGSTGKGAYEYLEMQSSSYNGWKPFSDKPDATLSHRFGCKRSHTMFGMPYEKANILIELESLRGCKTFENALPYINTSPDKQKKGAGGHEK